jgi:hypothetical protein
MTSYNGFSSSERSAAQRWLEAGWRGGRLRRPTACCACGQDRGVIDAHAEDYSRPFTAEKLLAFPLCYVCHLMLHCRFGKGATAWGGYRRLVRLGATFAPAMTRDFGIIAALLAGKPRHYELGDRAPTRHPLDEIEAGRHDPRNEPAGASVGPRLLFD